jgi:uncharacterized protein (DUF2141 family)
MRKEIITTILVTMIGSLNVFCQLPNRGNLIFLADNFKSNKGKAMVKLFLKSDDVTKKPFLQAKAFIENGKAEIIITDLPFGEYAAILWHDENGNGILDHRWGMPAEPMGFSNNWKLSFLSGMPTFDKLRFEFTKQNPNCEIHVK